MRTRIALPGAAQNRFGAEASESVESEKQNPVLEKSPGVFVSVVMPTFDGAENPADDERRLRLVMEGLCRQNYPNFEVVVVNDGGGESAGKICNEYSHRLDLRYEYFAPRKTRDEPGRTSAARNCGIRHSRGELLVFLDADCIADEGMVAAHAAKFAPHHVTFGFRRHLSPERAREITIPLCQEFLEEHSTLDRRLKHGLMTQVSNEYLWVYCYGFSMAVPAHALETLGGFDEAIVGWGGEDIELAFRLRFAGMSFFPLLSAMVTHLDHPVRQGHPLNPFGRVRDTGVIHPLRAMVRNGGPLVRNRTKT
jgi:glycosyltransferase involved in cell wall biosynthesis